MLIPIEEGIVGKDEEAEGYVGLDLSGIYSSNCIDEKR